MESNSGTADLEPDGEPDGESGAEPDAERLVARLRAVALQRQDAWLELDITLPQLRALFAVRRRAGVTVSELAESLGQRLATTSALVNRMVAAGLLRRGAVPHDRRRIRLEVSERAERMLTAVDERAAARFSAILGRMSPQGRRALATALNELVELFTSELDPGGGK